MGDILTIGGVRLLEYDRHFPQGIGMIDQLYVENFKALKKLKLDISNLTVLIGPNGTGKSSVFQLLLLLKQSASSSLLFDGPFLHFGSYEDAVHRGRPDLRIKAQIVGRLSPDTAKTAPDELSPSLPQPIRYFRELHFGHPGDVTYGMGRIGSREGYLEAKWDATGEIEDAKFDTSSGTFRIRGVDRIGNLFRLVSRSIKEEMRKEGRRVERFLGLAPAQLTEDLRKFYVVRALRGFDRPSYQLLDDYVEDISRYDKSMIPAANAASTLAYKRELEDSISKMSREVFGKEIQGTAVPRREAAVLTEDAGLRINIVNDGFGLNQSFHAFLQLSLARPHSIVAIEEPEAHLHPKAQAAISRVLVKIAHEGNIKLMLATHSEHILMGILSAIAKKEISPREVNIYEFSVEDFEATARPLKILQDGRIEGGLKDFFEADLESISGLLGGSVEK